VYYHARIQLKSKRAKEPKKVAVEVDLTRENLLNKIVVPYVNNQRFFLGGVQIEPSEVDEVLFGETEGNATQEIASIQARQRASGYIGVINFHSVVRAGRNITRILIEEASSLATADKSNEVSASARKHLSDKVFIVHGHDQRALEQTEILIHRFGLVPVILHYAPNSGNTVIEKFERHAEVGIAIVLLTPDDVGGISESQLLPRARQNAIWEWGYLVAKLGRSNVICLYKDGVEMPSDLNGLVTIKIGNQVIDKTEEIRREFVAQGYRLK
jgi:predicted nucleotide-binding protein